MYRAGGVNYQIYALTTSSHHSLYQGVEPFSNITRNINSENIK